MGAIEQARINAENARKAAELDGMRNTQALNDSYKAGAQDLYSEVEQRMIQQAQQDAMDREMQKAYARSSQQLDPINQSLVDLRGRISNAISKGANYVGNKLNGLADYMVDAAVGTPEQQSQYSAQGEAMRKEMENYQRQQALEAAIKRGEVQ